MSCVQYFRVLSTPTAPPPLSLLQHTMCRREHAYTNLPCAHTTGLSTHMHLPTLRNVPASTLLRICIPPANAPHTTPSQSDAPASTPPAGAMHDAVHVPLHYAAGVPALSHTLYVYYY